MIHVLMASVEAVDPQKTSLASDCLGKPDTARYAMAAAGVYRNGRNRSSAP
jgi:hypothetical protein